jgi:hypothetical protein
MRRGVIASVIGGCFCSVATGVAGNPAALALASSGQIVAPGVASRSEDLKRIGDMIAEGRNLEEVRNAWRALVERSRGINVEEAVKAVLNEARE